MRKKLFIQLAVTTVVILCGNLSVIAQSFVHPGLLHSQEDLDRMKREVAGQQEPIYSGYKVFIENPASQHTYKMQGPLEMVGRNPTVGQGAYDSDANAAHQNALMWAITGDTAYANKAMEIINAWSSTLKSITGRDAILMAGLGPFKMVNAAEILRYTNAGWKEADIQRCETHFKKVIYPVLKDFAPFANGNWDAAAIKTVMAIAVFCNDRAMFECALRYYVNGSGNGRLTFYVINEQGQIQETGRDQGHTQLGIGLLAEAAEIAWHQGLDLYGYANNRLLKGFEYTARYNLGNDVPFDHVLDRTGKYEHFKPSEQGRKNLRSVYEQVYNHYVNRMGLSAPFTEQAAAILRPEGPGKPGADHPGYGTLFYTRPRLSVDRALHVAPAVPGGIIATGSKGKNVLTWVASIGAKSYIIKRSVNSGGSYRIIAREVSASSYTDKQVKDGTVYYYTLSARNNWGESANACETGVASGLPAPWKQQDIGAVAHAGSSDFDGKAFRMEGSGMGMDSLRDAFHCIYQPLNGDGVITVRLSPEPNSQFSKMGITMRESTADNAAFVSLLVYPGMTGQIEAPSWHARLICRKSTGMSSSVVAMGAPLAGPAVTYGRLTGYYWLRLFRKGDQFSAFGSFDGQQWTLVGEITIALAKSLLVGIPVCSGMPNSTIIGIDNVSVKKGNGQTDASNSVYQYSVKVGSRRAYLWIPPQCRQVRGVIISLSNMLERRWLEDPMIRHTAASENLGIIWVGPGSRNGAASITANLEKEEARQLQQMFNDLAAVSGYSELTDAPIISMGHSANGQFAWAVPSWNAARTIAAIPVKTIPFPDSLCFSDVPLCYMVGQTTEWPQYRVPDPATKPGDRDFYWPIVRDGAIELRSKNKNNLIGVVTEPGGGHFDWSEKQARFLALYIRKACQYRLPGKSPKNGPVPLRKIDPASGWLTDTGGMDADHSDPAPYRKYKGDPGRAYWFFDEETANAAVAFNGDRKQKQRQMLTFMQDDTLLDVAKLGYASLQFNPLSDGVSFTVRGGFLTEMPRELIGMGTRLGHAQGVIRFRVIDGPVIQMDDSTFKVQFNRGNTGGPIWIQEEHPGDKRYRRAVQPGRISIPEKLMAGKVQSIHFEDIPDQKAGAKEVSLKATTDSGLPVEYYVVSGPAVVEDNKLKFTELPVRSKYPIKVTVVAYQWGRTIDPMYQSAEPVTRTFDLYK